MSRVKGSVKTGGRKKGTPNKASANFREFLDENNFNIQEQILELLPNLDPNKQMDVLLKLLDFSYPKFKAVQHQSVNSRTLSLTDWLHADDADNL